MRWLFSKHPGASEELWERAENGVLLDANDLALMMKLSPSRGRKLVLEMARAKIIPSIRVNRRVIQFCWPTIREELLKKYLAPDSAMPLRGLESFGQVPDGVLLDGALYLFTRFRKGKS